MKESVLDLIMSAPNGRSEKLEWHFDDIARLLFILCDSLCLAFAIRSDAESLAMQNGFFNSKTSEILKIINRSTFLHHFLISHYAPTAQQQKLLYAVSPSSILFNKMNINYTKHSLRSLFT